jgi:hypothetical protein
MKVVLETRRAHMMKVMLETRRAHMMKVMLETRRAQYIQYLRFPPRNRLYLIISVLIFFLRDIKC